MFEIGDIVTCKPGYAKEYAEIVAIKDEHIVVAWLEYPLITEFFYANQLRRITKLEYMLYIWEGL